MRAMLESERQLLMEKYESYSDQNRRVHDENNKTKVELDHVKLKDKCWLNQRPRKKV